MSAYRGHRIAAGLLSTVALAACTLEPTYHRPSAPVPATWTAFDTATATVPEIGWRDYFPDPMLQHLIETALTNNRDLRVAALNVQAAQAQYRIQRADLLPTLNATGSELAERFPANVPAASTGGTTTGGTSGITGGTEGVTTRVYNAGIGFTAYELDVFGRVRSLSHAALQSYLASAETRRSLQLSLIAEVASGYLTLLADQANLKVTREQLADQNASYDLIRRSLEAGTATALAARQQEIAVDTAGASLEAYTRQLAQDRNALAVLIGGPLPDELNQSVALDSVRLRGDLPASLPSVVLTRRPDVLAAEHQLKAANADIGAARAAFLPSISLTGSYGSASPELSGLFRSGSTAWTFAPQINLPIFAAGANRANLDLRKIEKNVAVAQYEKVLQNAFQEVDNALAARHTIDGQLAAQRALEQAAAEAYQLADLRFRSGVDSFLPVLSAQQTLYSAQQGTVGLELMRLQNMATLYKALGGGTFERAAGTGESQ